MFKLYTILLISIASFVSPAWAIDVSFNHGDCVEETTYFGDSTNDDELIQAAHKLMLCLAELSFTKKNMASKINRENSGSKYYKLYPAKIDVEIADDASLSKAPEGSFNVPKWGDCCCDSPAFFAPYPRGIGQPTAPPKIEPTPELLNFVISAKKLIEAPEENAKVLMDFVKSIAQDTTAGPLNADAKLETLVGGATPTSESVFGGENAMAEQFYWQNSAGGDFIYRSVAAGNCTCGLGTALSRKGGIPIPHDKFETPILLMKFDRLKLDTLGIGRFSQSEQ